MVVEGEGTFDIILTPAVWRWSFSSRSTTALHSKTAHCVKVQTWKHWKSETWSSCFETSWTQANIGWPGSRGQDGICWRWYCQVRLNHDVPEEVGSRVFPKKYFCLKLNWWNPPRISCGVSSKRTNFFFLLWLSFVGPLANSVLTNFILLICTQPYLSPAMRKLSENISCKNVEERKNLNIVFSFTMLITYSIELS